MKTAIQELLEYIEKYGSVVPLEQDRIYIKAEELLAKERKQLHKAYYRGLCEGLTNYDEIEDTDEEILR